MADRPLNARDILNGLGPQQSLTPGDDPTWAGQLGHKFEQGASGLGAGPSVTQSAGEIGQTIGGVLGSMSLHDAIPNLKEAYNRFRYGQPVQGAMSVLSALPMAPEAGAARAVGKDVVENVAKDTVPSILAYHGSPQTNLTSISAAPPARQFDNATSALGAFFAPDSGGAQRYAGDAGRVYSANVPLKNPYEMPVSEFLYLQDVTRGPRDADGFRGPQLPSDQWANRQTDLITEGAQLRQRLQEAGHDGVIIRDTKGNVREISSFNDVPLSQ